MLSTVMEEKRLDLNAPLLSVRRFASAPLPPPPASSSPNAAAGSRAENGGGTGRGQWRHSLPLYKSDLESGPVRNAGVVPFLWEQSPGLPKDGSGPGGGGAAAKRVAGTLLPPKPPPGRVPRRLIPEEEEKPISTDAISNGVLPRGPPPVFSTSVSTSTAHASIATAATASPWNGSFTIFKGSSSDEPNVNLKTKAVMEKAPIVEEQPDSSDDGDDEEDAFSDALDTLSRAESGFMNCSVSGLTAVANQREPSGRFSSDPQLRDFMMGRFLPAARAMAASPSPYAPRKPSVLSREPAGSIIEKVGERRRPAAPLPYQHRPNYALNHQNNIGNSEKGEDDDEEEEEDEEYGGAGHLPMKGCGLLPRFCMKSSLCLLNPVPGMKVRSRMPATAARKLRPQVRSSNHGSVGDAEDEHTWEEVYKHKMGRVNQILGEEASKLTSDSNQLSYWSDSQTADGSSSYRRSTGDGISPFRNDVSRSPLREGKGSVGLSNHGRRGSEDVDVFELCSKDAEEYWEITPHPGSTQTSRSPSPVIEKTVYMDSVKLLEDPGSRLSLSDTEGGMNCIHKGFANVEESKEIEECLTLGACEDNGSQHKVAGVVDADEVCSAERSGALETTDNSKSHVLNDAQDLEGQDQEENGIAALHALLPPPLPKSPSESWLWRTLPSVSSKNSTPLSLLGVQFYPKKHVIRASSTDPRQETMVKKSVAPKGKMRFADVLAKPASED